MGRRNQSDEATFTDNSKSARKAKHYEPATYRLAPHSKTRVAYFHDEGVGNYHYGVSKYPSINSEIIDGTNFQRFVFKGTTSYEAP
ncbi:hypothetical protein NQZ79_g5952 [Umbelopsis isabellina]|nr:hypothetical protein NQZ79_g5952 [Umbelopsis isabellina]